MGALPLSGIRVVDFSLVWAGPYGLTLLSDMGAEIVRVESRQHHITNTRGFIPRPTKDSVNSMGGWGRMYADEDPGETPWNRHALFNSLGRDRLAMTVDLTRPEGREIVHEIVKVSDVLIENNAGSVMKRLGVDYETLRPLNPTLVYVSMPLFGISGPYAAYQGFGMEGEAIAGLRSLRGYRDEDTTTAGSSTHMDAISGIAAAYAALVALYERDRTGRGQFVELAQIEHLINQIGGPLMDAAMNGRAQVPLGNRDPVRAPQGTYPCVGEDRWIAISVGTDEEWVGLCRAMGRQDLADAPEYRGSLTRHYRHDELDQLIAGWTAGRDARELTELLQAHGVPAGTLATDQDVYEDPHLEARGFFHSMEHLDCGRHLYPGHAFKYSETPLRFDAPAPLLGQHNDYIYRQLLGLPEAQVQRLTELGHIGDTYTDDVR